MANKRKTPDYTIRAINKYYATKDRVMVTLPEGTADLIRNKIGLSCNKYISNLVMDDLRNRGLLSGSETESAETDDKPIIDPETGLELPFR